MERGKPVSGRCTHLYPITAVLLEEERRLTFLSMDNEVCLAWVADALQQLRQEGRTKAVGYLEAVLEEVVFEAKMPPSTSASSILYKLPMARCDSDCSAVRVLGCSPHAAAPHTDARE